jgi:ribosomal protein L37AE/L43A
MRLTDARFGRDLLRYRLALGLLHFHARSRTIERWTGLSIYRLRTLREYLSDAPELAVTPLRGVSPRQPAVFFRSAHLRTEAALLGGFLHLFKVIPPGEHIEKAAEVMPSLARGLRLCRAYRQFTSLLPVTSVSIEYAILLLVELARGKEIALSNCKACGVMVLVDRLAVGAPRCAHCQHELQAGLPRVVVLQAQELTISCESKSVEEKIEGVQGRLF